MNLQIHTFTIPFPGTSKKVIYHFSDCHLAVLAVLAGHLHFNHICPVTDTLTQYVSSQGMCGHLNRYVIGD